MRLILASQSPSRLDVLRRAGCDPEVIVSGADETSVTGVSPVELAGRLAELKGRAVTPDIGGEAALIACDSVLELDGRACGKPGTPERAVEQWRRMRGRSGVLHTGHFLWVRDAAGIREWRETVSTVVAFAEISDAEIDAYVDTGEPLWVAGAFTIDGYGAGFIERIEGDHTNVIGLSVPALRRGLLELGLAWPDLWAIRELR